MEEKLGENMKENQKKFIEKSSGDMTKRDVRMMSPLQLAYLGDVVYELLVRTYLIEKKNVSVNKLHKEAVKYVKAEAQAQILFSLEDILTEEEWAIVKRGRNAKSGSVPKNAKLTDYKYATGFEALIGYLYIIGEIDRIFKLFSEITLD